MNTLNSISDLQSLVLSGFTDWKQYGFVHTKRMDDLILFNYTPEAMYAGNWTFLERASRGLILNINTGEVVARPFDKFFNWYEGGRLPSTLEIRTITEKMDGSLGILYRHHGQYRVATRGSFDSEQAQWATAHLNAIYCLDDLPDDLTLLFEIIYPDNRIVIDYGHDEALYLLAMRNRFTGEYAPYADVQMMAEGLEMPCAPVHSFVDMDAILASTAEIDHEGFVVEFADGSRFKIKGDKYRALHKIISQVSFNAVLDALMLEAWKDYRIGVPEEFWPEIDGYHDEIMQVVDSAYTAIMGTMTDDVIASFATRKDMAVWVQQQPRHLQPFYFKRFDDKFQRMSLFKLVERRSVRTRIDKGEA